MRELDRRRMLKAMGALGVAGLAGCSGDGEETTAGNGNGGGNGNGNGNGSGQTTTTSLPDSMTAWAWNDPSLQPTRERQAEELKSASGMGINWETFPFGDYTAKYTSALQGGNAPDALALSVLWVPRYGDQGAIENLEEHGFSKDDYLGGARANSVYDDTLWSVPWYADCRALGVNKTMFEEAGLDVPDKLTAPTWEEWANWVDALTEEHGAGYGMPAGEGFDGFMLSNGVPGYLTEDGSEAAVNSDAAIEAGEFLQPMVEDDKVQTYTGGGATTAGAEFEAGNLPMYYAGSWDFGRQKDAIGDDFMYVPHPKGPKSDVQHTWSAGVYYSVPSRGGANTEAGMRFLEYIDSVEVQAGVTEAIGGFPGRKEAYEADAFTSYIDENPALETIEQEMENTISFPNHPESGTMWTAVHNQAQAMWTGTGVEEALNKAAEEINSVV